MFAFAGQASQYPGMGRYWAAHCPGFTEEWQHIGDLLRAQLPPEPLSESDVRRTYREIFAVQYALARSLQAHGIRPAATLGVSMGEICAVTIAGAMTEADALDLVNEQARCIWQLCPAGGMVAVPAQPDCLTALPTEPRCEVAMVSRRHFILAGDRAGLARLRQRLRQRGIASFVLPVERGFHSPAIDSASSTAGRLGSYRPSTELPIVSCASTDLTYQVPEPDHLWSAIRRPIRFVETARALSRTGPYAWVDLGPGASISSMLAHNEIPAIAVHTLLASRRMERIPAGLLPISVTGIAPASSALPG